MKHIFRTFFGRVWTSLTRPSRYMEFLRQPTSAAVKYLYGLLTLTFFVTMFLLLIGFFFSLPLIQQGIATLDRDLPSLYPQELVVTLKKGEISTNMQEPYFIDLPQHWQDFLQKRDGSIAGQEPGHFPRHFITFDSAASVEEYAPEDSFVLVTRKFIVLPDKDLSYRVISVDQSKQDFTFNREIYDRLATPVSQFLRYVPTVLTFLVIAGFLLFPFVGAAFTLLGYLLYLLVFVLLIWVIAMIMRKKVGYWNLYRLSLHGLTLPLLVSFVGGWIHLQFPYLFSILFLVWMTVVLAYLPKKIVSRA
ncbi:MAG: DUF1189 family protein [Candidatus Peregrinibacteria bacterium]